MFTVNDDNCQLKFYSSMLFILFVNINFDSSYLIDDNKYCYLFTVVDLKDKL